MENVEKQLEKSILKAQEKIASVEKQDKSNSNVAITCDKQDSIKVSKTSTGKYSYEIKLYFNAEKEHHQNVVDELKQIETKLKQQFEGEGGL